MNYAQLLLSVRIERQGRSVVKLAGLFELSPRASPHAV